MPTSLTDASPGGLRLAELMLALSVATDFAMGQPAEHAMAGCLVAVRLGQRLGYDAEALRTVYYQALLRFIGCNIDTQILASIAGDELVARSRLAEIDTGKAPEVVKLVLSMVRAAQRNSSVLSVAREMARAMMALGSLQKTFEGHCEVAQRLAQRIGFGEATIEGLGQLYERWDGRGLPRGLAGEAVSPAVRVATLAHDVVLFARLGGVDAAVDVARKRSGSAYDPRVAEAFRRDAHEILREVDAPRVADLLDLEPTPHLTARGADIESALEAMADFTDVKTTFTVGHSVAVATLARGAAAALGLPDAEANTLTRAAMLHDLGRTGVSVGIWEKTGALSDADWEKIRLYPYYTDRILSRAPSLAAVAAVASAHAERLDGRGYHRGLDGRQIPLPARILAAADVARALSEPRPHRPARDSQAIAMELRGECRKNRLDADAVEAVLSSMGQRSIRAPRRYAGGLTSRELDVLREIAAGRTMAQIAKRLGIAPKTVDAHIQHVYSKIGVKTRAGATLFAAENLLLGRDE